MPKVKSIISEGTNYDLTTSAKDVFDDCLIQQDTITLQIAKNTAAGVLYLPLTAPSVSGYTMRFPLCLQIDPVNDSKKFHIKGYQRYNGAWCLVVALSQTASTPIALPCVIEWFFTKN